MKHRSSKRLGARSEPQASVVVGRLLAAGLFAGLIATPAVAAETGVGPVSEAIAVLHPTQGNTARGTVIFRPTPNGVALEVAIEGLPSGTKHGFHVHEFGDCSAPDGSSAGEHYDPTHMMPGKHRHGMLPLGDLENLAAGADGRVSVKFEAPKLSIAGENPILGRALLLHATFADPKDPMGDAGARIACGTIGRRSPQP
jgi:Cu-Zn family superoxide dismutase